MLNNKNNSVQISRLVLDFLNYNLLNISMEEILIKLEKNPQNKYWLFYITVTKLILYKLSVEVFIIVVLFFSPFLLFFLILESFFFIIIFFFFFELPLLLLVSHMIYCLQVWFGQAVLKIWQGIYFINEHNNWLWKTDTYCETFYYYH